MILLLPALTAAQTAPDQTSMPTIVVTATRSETPAFETAASIDSVSLADPAANTPGINPSEYLATIPGLIARDRQNYAQDEQISIRGFGARSSFGVRGVRLYVDGIPATMPDGQGQVSNFNLGSGDRIEVLRGPFSALYGNSSGGVIQIFTADGTTPSELRGAIDGGSYGTYRIDFNARGSGNALDYNVDLSHFYTDGYRGHGRAERDSGNAKVDIHLDGDRKLTLLANTVVLP
ncbi:MAG TPA: TonB-dependent receptor plug domain-containing protein, partial [Rudaea sp.]|nr:TonB-dependent receptor plug domain-containing protein [Rudaea sp.]